MKNHDADSFENMRSPEWARNWGSSHVHEPIKGEVPAWVTAFGSSPEPHVMAVKRWCSILRRGPLQTAPGVERPKVATVPLGFLVESVFGIPYPVGTLVHDELVIHDEATCRRLAIGVQTAFTNWLRRQKKRK